MTCDGTICGFLCDAGYFQQSGGCHAAAIDIAVGWHRSCALIADGSVWCWGAVPYDETLGAESGLEVVDQAVLTPQKVVGVDDAIQIAAGDKHSCALLRDGTVKCWGLNMSLQLGAVAVQDFSTVALTVAGLPAATSVACGSNHSCALLADGSARCWGSNEYGELGAGAETGGSAPDSLTPLVVSGVSNARLLAAGTVNTCVVLASGEVQCWGSGSGSQLGSTVTSLSSTPVTIAGISSPSALTVGAGFMCGLLSGGAIKCWGGNLNGQLGAPGPNQPTPVDVIGISGATSIGAAYGYACVTLADGLAWCWGSGPFRGTTDPWVRAGTPVAVMGVSAAIKISLGVFHSCALLSDGSLMCWGTNPAGEVGNGSTSITAVPQPVIATW